jgi:DNA-directed RNA polymerase subunit M/transcription elongation factor TFIIS
MANKFTFEYVKEFVEHKGFVLISTSYANTHSKLHIKCNKHDVFECSFNNFKRRGCPKCGRLNATNKKRLDYTSVKNTIESYGYKLLSKEYKNAKSKLKIFCYRHGEFSVSFNNFTHPEQRGCQKCGYERTKNKLLLDFGELKKEIEKLGYEVLSKTYTGYNHLLELICPQKHKCSISWSNLKRGKGCRRCFWKESKGEKDCREIIESKTGHKFPNSRPDFMKNPLTNYLLELDGYCEKLKIAFEYDGKQHYEAIDFWGGEVGLKKTQERDKIKDELCKNNDIYLIRVPYFVENKEDYIEKNLKYRSTNVT